MLNQEERKGRRRGAFLAGWVFAVFAVACGSLPGMGRSGSSPLSPLEAAMISAYAGIDPSYGFETLLKQWRNPPSDSSPEMICLLNAAMMTSTSMVAGTARQDKRIAASGDKAEEILEKSWRYLEQKCSAYRDKQSEGARAYAVYYQRTNQIGLGLRHAKKALELSPEKSFERLAAASVLSQIYDAQGWFEERDSVQKLAIDTGHAYYQFDVSKRPAKPSAGIAQEPFRQFLAHLENQRKSRQLSLAEASRPGEGMREWTGLLDTVFEQLSWAPEKDPGLKRMREVWADYDFACQAFIAKCMLLRDAYPFAVIRFARAGDAKYARSLFEAAQGAMQEGLRPEGRFNYEAAEAALLAAEGKTGEAAERWAHWLRNLEGMSAAAAAGQANVLFVDPADSNKYRIVGGIHEAAGKTDRAIEFFEKSIAKLESNRSSFDVQSRLRFLRGQSIQAYWGLLRSYAKRYLARKNEADFNNALRVAGMLSARQFGETMGITDSNRGFDPARLQLREGELVLVVLQTDKAVVSFGLSKDWHGAAIHQADPASLNGRIHRLRKAIARPGGGATAATELLAVSEVILGPFRERIAAAQSVIVVSDGLISGIPFSLLSESREEVKPLAANRSVWYSPSLSVLAAARAGGQAAQGDQLLAIADPAYGERTKPERLEDSQRPQYDRAVSALGLFSPLPETRVEVGKIGESLGKKATILAGADARESQVKKLDLAPFGYVHFATHGVLGNQLPGLREPALVLAEEPGEDGFLTMSEVQALRLRANLTVLSACDTGTGEYFQGEGVMGLGRAFLMAGSRSVLATLWPIDSDSTVEFMDKFYGRIRGGEAKADALRNTQVEFLGLRTTTRPGERGLVLDHSQAGAAPSRVLRDPYFWAPFVLYGE